MNALFEVAADGRILLADERLAEIERGFSLAGGMMATNHRICSGTNDSGCTNEGDCRGSTNSDMCSNSRTCAL
jgi:hypothetical protein